MEFSGKNWFNHYFGFEENSNLVMKNIKITDFDDHSEIHSKLNQRKINCGKFSLRDMNSYKEIVDNLSTKKCQEGHLHVIHGNGSLSKKLNLVDIILQQNNEEFNGATFVSASNFNLLEFGSSDATAHNGISNYAVDYTQGPAFATATIGSTMYRTYFVKHREISSSKIDVKNPNSNSNYFIDYTRDQSQFPIATGQLDRELNLLERTPIPVIHGKAYLNHLVEGVKEVVDSQFFNDKNIFDFTNENFYEIAVIQNAEVTTSRSEKIQFSYIDSKPGQFVHQVFASSFDLGSYVERNERNLEIMRYLLFYEYKMCILQAVENSLKFPGRKGSNKLVLPLLGAGFFRNPIEIVTEAIRKNKDLIIASGLDIYVLCYSDSNFNETFPLLKETVESTNGTVVDAR